MNAPVYLDYQATTPVDRRVLDAMTPYFSEKFGNPASRQHRFGWVSEEAVESARAAVARSINAKPREIVFTSGATESNNLAVKGIAELLRSRGSHIVTVLTEHKSVLDACIHLEKQGFRVTYLPVDEFGVVDLDRLHEALTPETILVSVMAANNEVGTLQKIADIGSLCREKEVYFHTDATQAVGKMAVNVESMSVDLLSLSGHKIYGPKGVGALFVRHANPRVKVAMQMDGGGHEHGMRSGTLNVPGIVGLGAAVDLAAGAMNEDVPRLRRLRDKLFGGMSARLDDICLNGHPTERLPNNLNVSFLGVDANALMMSMKDVAVSTGSACSTADPEPSHVLKALHLSADRMHSAIRFGIGRPTTDEEVDFVIGRVVEGVNTLRKLSPSYRSRHSNTEQLSSVSYPKTL